MAQSIFYAPDNSIKAQTLTVYSGQVMLPTWQYADAWVLNGSTLTETVLSGTVSGIGFVQGVRDAGNGVWLAQYGGSYVHISAAGVFGLHAIPSGDVTYGATFTSGVPYALQVSGTLYSALTAGTSAVSPAPAFGSVPAKFLAVSGNTLYSILPSVSGIGTFTLSTTGTGTSGLITPPLDQVSAIAVSGVNVAAAGTNPVTFASGYTDLAMIPGTGSLLLAVQQGSGTLTAYTGQGSGIWTQTQTVTGLTAPTNVAWSPNDVYAFVADSNALRIYTNTLGTVAQTQSLSAVSATATSVTSDNLTALVTRGAANSITSYGFNGSTWAVSASMTLAAPTAILTTGVLSAVAGFASGIAYLQSIAGAWSVQSSAALPFSPTAIAIDPFTNAVYAAGTKTGSGFVAMVSGTTLASSGNWVGSGNDVIYTQGQIGVLDAVNSTARVFGVVANALVLEATMTATFPSGCTTFAQSASSIFVAGTSQLGEYAYTGPYQLRRTRQGAVSLYNGSSWSTAQLGASGHPTALSFDPSGNVSAALLENALYTISTAGAIVSGAPIAQFAGQPQSVPLGISSLLWFGSSLYASTVLNDALIQVQ